VRSRVGAKGARANRGQQEASGTGGGAARLPEVQEPVLEPAAEGSEVDLVAYWAERPLRATAANAVPVDRLKTER
jgi:hypothetical protein